MHFSTMLAARDWGDQVAASKYLEKYWLPETEYEKIWKPIQDQIFVRGKRLPDLVFSNSYELLAFRGGCLFVEEDFTKLQECFIKLGNSHFAIVENPFLAEADEPLFRMKYPASISWNELISGNYISAIILESDIKEFYVFGETSAWGKYSASSYKHPVDIVGFLPNHASFFRETLKVEEDEKLEIAADWMPFTYRPFLK
jgi:hypothetical protein